MSWLIVNGLIIRWSTVQVCLGPPNYIFICTHMKSKPLILKELGVFYALYKLIRTHTEKLLLCILTYPHS